MMRLLELLARIPGTLLPFAVGLGVVSSAGVGWWAALVGGICAAAGFVLSGRIAQALVARGVSWGNLLLGQTVAYVVLVVLLIAATEQQRLWTVLLLSLLAGTATPAERICVQNRRLDRSALGVGVLLALVCGLVGAWSIPLAVCGLTAAAAVPVLVMRRYRVDSEESP